MRIIQHNEIAREPFRSGSVSSCNLGNGECYRIDILPLSSLEDGMRDRVQAVSSLQHRLQISAAIAESDAFDHLDAPVERIATLDTPIPYNARLERAALPSAADIVKVAERLV